MERYLYLLLEEQLLHSTGMHHSNVAYLISNRAATDPVGGSGVAIPNINNTPTVVDGLLAGGYYLIVSDPNCADNKVIQFVTVSPPSGIANYYILHANMRSTFLLHRPVR